MRQSLFFPSLAEGESMSPFFSCKKSCRKQQNLVYGRISPFTVSPTLVKFKNTCKESEKVGLKLNFRKRRSWHPVPSLHGKQMGKQWMTFIFLGSKITADGDCSHEIKRHLLLGRKVMTNLDSILKTRNITLPTKVHLVKAMVFPVVMYGCESWTLKKAEHRRIDAF